MAILTWRVRAALALAAALLVSMGRSAQAQERDRGRDRPGREDRAMGRGDRGWARTQFRGPDMDRFRFRRFERLGRLGREFRFRAPRDFAFRFRMPLRSRAYGARIRDWGPIFDGREREWDRFDRAPFRGELRDRIRERLRSRHWRYGRFGRI